MKVINHVISANLQTMLIRNSFQNHSSWILVIAVSALTIFIASGYFPWRNLSSQAPLLILSVDGFRHDYIETTKRILGPYSLPNFDRFIAKGTRALRLVNIFPTLTLPVHQTIVTGLHPQSHGITANTMKDASIESHLLSMVNKTSLRDDPWLDERPEPLWVTAQRDFGLRTATHLWPLTDRPVSGIVPTRQVTGFYRNVLGECYYPDKYRIDDVVEWLLNYHEGGKIKLILSYFSVIDEMGHLFGPESQQVGYLLHLNNNIWFLKLFNHEHYVILRSLRSITTNN